MKYLASELVKLGHEVHVMYSLDAYRAKRQQMYEDASTNGIYAHVVATPFNSSAYAAYLFGNSRVADKIFSRLVKEIRPDVVHHNNISLLGYSLFKKRGNYVNLYTAHDYWLFCQQNNLLKYGVAECKEKNCFQCSLRIRRPRQVWRYFPAFQHAIEELDLVIAPSKFMLQTLRNEFSTLNLTHITNFVPRPIEDENDRKKERFFVYVGVLERHKGLIPLLENYARYLKHDRSRGLGLKIIGTGSLHDFIDDFIRENELDDCVSMLGRLPSVWEYLARGIALVLPSICPENAPLVALESLSTGTPVIGADIGGIPEIVNSVDRRLVFSWESAADFERALDFACENQEELRTQAFHAFSRQFSPEVYTRRYFEEIDRLGAGGPCAS